MAAKAPIQGAELELAHSLVVDQIPEKLRCATCDKLAVNPQKLACCGSTICGDCHENMNSVAECPVCQHSPFDKEDAIPAKALQTTVKVFLKTEAKKRGYDPKTFQKMADTPAPAAADAVETSPPIVVATPTEAESNTVLENAEDASNEAPAVDQLPAADGEAAPAAQTEEPPVNDQADEQDADDESEDEDDVVITMERPELEEDHIQQQDDEQQQQDTRDQMMQMDQQQSFGGFGPGVNNFANGNFGNMNMGMNGMNPMMMGMPGFGMNMPNMMGMPNMGMDPSMMFGGMNDMSAMMGMGMGGMGGMNGMNSGMNNFDFSNGMGGYGSFPNQGNYMYGNGNQRQHHFTDRGSGRGYGRGYGRGSRGTQFGRGRGGWAHHGQNYQGYNQQSIQNSAARPQSSSAVDATEVTPQRRGSPVYDSGQGQAGTSTGAGDQSQTAVADGDQDAMDTNEAGADTTDETADHEKQNGDAMVTEEANQNGEHANGEQDSNGIQNGHEQHDEGSMQVDAIDQSTDYDRGMQNQQQYGHGGPGSFRGGRGFDSRISDSTDLTPKPAPPVNAPSGPKAMRLGLKNTAWAGRQASIKQPLTPAPEVKAPLHPPESTRMDDIKQDERADEPSRSRSRARSVDHKDSAREADDGYESEETRSRRKRRERRDRDKRDEREDRYDDERHGRSRDLDKSGKKYRSRSDSRTDDSSRRRHRGKDDEHHSSRSHRDREKDRHRRRHRSRSPAKDTEAEDDHSRRKGRSERDYDDHKDRRTRKHSKREDDTYEDDRRDRSHRSSKHERSSRDERKHESVKSQAVIEQPSDDMGFKIKGRNIASAKKNSDMPPPSRDRRLSSVVTPTEPGASSDPYAAERALAQGQREAREAQRRQSTQSSSFSKRGRDGSQDDLDAPRGPKGDRGRIKKVRRDRKFGYKYEGEVGVDERESFRRR